MLEKNIPKYYHISDLIKQNILNGVWEEGSKIPAERNLMKEYSVSRNTIRNAILKLINEGFLFSEVGRGTFVNSNSYWTNKEPVISKNKLISLIITDVITTFGRKIVRGAEDTIFNSSYSLVVCQAYRSLERVKKYINNILGSGVQGVIMDPINVSDFYEANREILNILDNNNIPVVLIDRKIPLIDKCYITTNNKQIAYNVSSQLIKKGFKKIIIIKNKSRILNLRFQGIQKSLKEHNIPLSQCYELNLEIDEVYERDLKIISSFIKKHRDADLVFSLNQYYGHICLKALNTLNIQYPEDLSFISFDHPDDLYFKEGEIAYIEQPLIKMGKTAAKTIIGMIENKDTKNKDIVIKSKYHPGSSIRDN